MTILYPKFFYNIFNKYVNVNYIIFEIIMLVIHLIPLYLFKNKQKINETNIKETIINTLVYLILYDLIFYSSLELYPLKENEMIILMLNILFTIYIIIKKYQKIIKKKL